MSQKPQQKILLSPCGNEFFNRIIGLGFINLKSGVRDMKKVRTIFFIMAIVGYVVWSHDPIDDTMNFIIGGIVPGTDIVLGFWHTVLMICLFGWAIKRTITAIRLQLLEHTAQQITKEKMKEEFSAQHAVTFDKNQRSVIAAPTNSSISS